jgi:shikimate kinase
MNNIILVGFMGCGKSSTARYIAKNYNYKFIDTDKLIEKKAKMTISDIFSTKGENYFRNIEKQIISTNLAFSQQCVIATGGGLPCHFNNITLLKKIGWVFWLNISFDNIINRVKNKINRPLLNDLEKAKELYEKRIGCYSKAHFSIDANKSTSEVAKEIISKIIA